MPGWVIWIIVACVLGAGEVVLTTGFLLAPFAVGALVAALVTAIGAGGVFAGVTFLVVSVLLLGVVRPISHSYRRQPPVLRTGTGALVGRPGVVVERIANHEGIGCVRIDAEVWTARAFDDEQVIDAGKRVEVLEIRGATALVSE